MFLYTLGGLIKDYRIQKRLSQLDVSLKLGWKDTTRISKIEQGRVGKPNRTTVERIMQALELTEQERGNFLLVGGYLPSDNEIAKILKDNKQKIDTWQYPAYLMDFSFRWLYSNPQTLIAANIPVDKIDWIIKNKPNFLEFPFVSKELLPVEVMKGEDKDTVKPFAIAEIAAFKTENEPYQYESWYQKLIKDLMKYEKFRELWPKVDQSMYHKKLFDYEYKTMKGTYQGKELRLHFHITTGKVINDPRFQIVFYFPANKETEKLYS
ncbi:MAG TPA: helix-turn-helix transcriptional regulator, partial [Verrucomicrobiae bacterium]|nr:helix-turn-helix transcriptional regulator [Verrucomicrobiae bacterium]